MRAFITGVSGFAGSHLAEHLVACGDVVLGSCAGGRLPTDLDPQVAARIDVLHWDITRDPDDALRRRLADLGPQCVFHLAALSVPRHCGGAEPSEAAWQVNVEGTRRVIELARQLSPRPRLLLVSSAHVYRATTGPAAKLSERAPLGPQGGYGKTKLAAENLVRQAAESGLDTLIVRAFPHAGPRQPAELMLPEWIRQLLEETDQPLEVKCLDSYLDLSDVRDVVRGYRALAAGGEPGTVYNIGSGVARRSGDLLEMLCRLCGSRRAVHERSPGVQWNPIADTRRLRAATGWSPRMPLETTLLDSWNYWLHRERAT